MRYISRMNVRVFLLSSVAIFIILAVSFLITIGNELRYFAEQEHDAYFQRYEMNVRATGLLADVIFETHIHTPTILELIEPIAQLDTTEETAAIIRAELYQRLTPVYQSLVGADIQQLHFHTPDNISFLRFHRPELYGDDLTEFRPSIVHVNQTQERFRGFEEGRIFNGYRHVYPLVWNEQHIGSVEISSSLLSFKRAYESSSNDSVDFLLFSDTVTSSVFHSELDNYRSHPLHSLLLVQTELDRHDQDHATIAYTTKQKLFAQFAKRPSVQKAIKEHLPYYGLRYHQGTVYSLQFTPLLSGVDNIPVGVVVGLNEFDFLNRALPGHFKQLFIFLVIAIVFGFILQGQRSLLKKLRFLASHDKQTGLYNRSHFIERVRKILVANSTPPKKFLTQKLQRPWVPRNYALILFDIDNFKSINDTYGHDVGDLALEVLAASIDQVTRDGDIYCRWGGEEFMGLVRGDLAVASEIAEKLRVQIEKDSSLESRVPEFTCSFGVVEIAHIDEFERQFKTADQMLYQAKAQGKNCVVSAV